MKAFHPTKLFKRIVKIRSSDRAIADAQWVLTFGISGIIMHKLGHRSESWRLSWRSVISHALVHSAGLKRIQ